MVWWMALKRSEKNSRSNVEFMVVNAEQSICEDNLKRINVSKIDLQGKSG